ncbi:hypothetical protein DPMN_055175 [Dreissena polymorpha]|uniref:Uncharacterized protein n=1 Tax=Dreissena polymorpha TaxID=45954 RepID=A0A9D4CR66_DREPO|nr:hypothetical protein DPMN_055175 [Dreissena polymorpha]
MYYGSAEKFVNAARHFQDEVFTRLADLLSNNQEECIKSVISADLYCHNTCLQIMSNRILTTSSVYSSIAPFLILTIFLQRMNVAQCCTMSDIVKFALSLLEEGEVLISTFLNRDMKQLIISHYGHSFTISTNSGVNKSDIIFSSDISADDIVVKLKNQDIMQEASAQLRKLLKDVDFCLQDLCDSTDLKSSWERTRRPGPLLTCLSALFKVQAFSKQCT